MRFRFLFALFVLAASITTATAKDWDQMNGHERRFALISYLDKNQLQCAFSGYKTIGEQEAQLARYSWAMVSMGIAMYCKRDAQRLAKRE